MWLPILLLLGVVIYAAGRERGAAAPPLPQRALLPPPGPIAVLGEFVRIGQVPPPPVILCAIAEAESIGRPDLATNIIRIFVEPVVNAQMPQFQAPQQAPPVVQDRIYAPSFRSARHQGTPNQMSHSRGSCERPQSPRDATPRAQGPFARSPEPQQVAQRYNPTADEIQRMLDTDPERSIAALTRDGLTRTTNDQPALDARQQESEAELAMLNALADATGEEHLTPQFVANVDAIAYGIAKLMHTPLDQLKAEADVHRAVGEVGDFDTQPGSDWDRQFSPGHPLSPQPGVEPPVDYPSPLAGIPDDVWSHFCGKLVREAPAYQSARHVGQYRQRRERLAELGIDPESIIGSPEMQRAALDADLADAYRHAADDASGLASNVNRKIMLPNQSDPTTITLSGVLGVIQAAGLEGAVGWLESPRDRKRFPHTTQAFTRCNGVF